MQLNGQVALVTGGSRGIGRAACVALARAGADVVVHYNENAEAAQRVVDEITALGRKSVAVQADVADAEAIERMMKEVGEFTGERGLRLLFNNAGIYPPAPFESLGPEEWDRIMSVNLRGAYLCTWYAFPLLKAADNARVLFMSSNVAFLGTPGLPHYVAAKAGLIGLTRALARELGPHHINVNCVVPSLVQTESTELLFPGGEGPIMAAQAIRRRSVPEDVVGLVVFLAADESEFITGQTISVDGGLVTR